MRHPRPARRREPRPPAREERRCRSAADCRIATRSGSSSCECVDVGSAEVAGGRCVCGVEGSRSSASPAARPAAVATSAMAGCGIGERGTRWPRRSEADSRYVTRRMPPVAAASAARSLQRRGHRGQVARLRDEVSEGVAEIDRLDRRVLAGVSIAVEQHDRRHAERGIRQWQQSELGRRALRLRRAAAPRSPTAACGRARRGRRRRRRRSRPRRSRSARRARGRRSSCLGPTARRARRHARRRPRHRRVQHPQLAATLFERGERHALREIGEHRGATTPARGATTWGLRSFAAQLAAATARASRQASRNRGRVVLRQSVEVDLHDRTQCLDQELRGHRRSLRGAEGTELSPRSAAAPPGARELPERARSRHPPSPSPSRGSAGDRTGPAEGS